MLHGQCPRCGKKLWADGTHTCTRPEHERRSRDHREDGYRGRDYTEGEQLRQGFAMMAMDGDD